MKTPRTLMSISVLSASAFLLLFVATGCEQHNHYSAPKPEPAPKPVAGRPGSFISLAERVDISHVDWSKVNYQPSDTVVYIPLLDREYKPEDNTELINAAINEFCARSGRTVRDVDIDSFTKWRITSKEDGYYKKWSELHGLWLTLDPPRDGYAVRAKDIDQAIELTGSNVPVETLNPSD